MTSEPWLAIVNEFSATSPMVPGVLLAVLRNNRWGLSIVPPTVRLLTVRQLLPTLLTTVATSTVVEPPPIGLPLTIKTSLLVGAGSPCDQFALTSHFPSPTDQAFVESAACAVP